MVSSSPETDPVAYFGFTDLNGFKDFVVFVLAYAPDMFPEEDWRRPEDQMNLDRAFAGLQYGLQVMAKAKGESELVARCRDLVDQGHAEYHAGRDHAGQLKLEELETLLKKVPS